MSILLYSILLRSLLWGSLGLLVSFGALLLIADPLRAQPPPLPAPPVPAPPVPASPVVAPPLPAPPRPDNAQLESLRDRFAHSGVTHPQPSLAAQQDVHFPEHLPPSRSATQQASFMTSPISAPEVLSQELSEGVSRDRFEEAFYFGDFDEYEMGDPDGLRHAMLDRPLGGRLSDFGEDESQARGWRDKLATPNFAPIISVGSTLLIVIAAFFILALFLRKVSPQSSRALPKEAFECLGRYYLTQKHQLQLLRMGNRIILVSVMSDGVSTLAEITDPDEAVSLLGLCRRLDTNSATEMFRKTVAGISEAELSRPLTRSLGTAGTTGTVGTSPRKKPAAFDLYSEPDDESLAAILARGRQHGR